MRWVWRGLLAVVALVAVLAAVVVYRTATFEAPGAGAAVRLPPATAIDGPRAAVRLGEAIRIRTVTHQNPAEDDPHAWTELHAWLQATYPNAHGALRRETLAGRTLLYTWPGIRPELPPIVLMAHQDVVPVTPGTEGQWRRPPFGGEVADRVVWGRGAVDDKGSLVALMEAADALAASGFRPERTVLLAFGHDEETRGTGAQAVAAAMKARGQKAWFTLDEGLAIVADHPITGGPVAVIGVAEKGYGTLRLTAKAEGGHSSMPPDGDRNAVVALSKAVTAVAERPFPARYGGPARDMLRAVAGEAPWATRMAVANEWLFGPVLADQIGATPAGAAMLRTTTAPTMLEGSPKENVLPQTATARINFRLHPQDTPEEVLARARATIGDLPVEVVWDSPPNPASPVSSSSGEAWRLLAATAEASGGAPVAPGLVLGATDSRHMAGVSADVYRFQPVRMSLDELGMIHGTNERISVENLDRMAEFYARLIRAAAG